MKTTTSFFGLLGLTATMLFFVSCSNNDATPTANAARNGNQTMSASTPYGNLRIINNTNHEFVQDLAAFNNPDANGANWTLWLNVRISPNSDVTLTNYHDPYLLGMDVGGIDKWSIVQAGILGIGSVNGGNAINNANADYHMNLNGDDDYVQWVGMEPVLSTDNLVRLYFKLDYTHHDAPVVNNELSHIDADGHTYIFKTIAYVDTDGVTIIDIEDYVAD